MKMDGMRERSVHSQNLALGRLSREAVERRRKEQSPGEVFAGFPQSVQRLEGISMYLPLHFTKHCKKSNIRPVVYRFTLCNALPRVKEGRLVNT